MIWIFWAFLNLGSELLTDDSWFWTCTYLSLFFLSWFWLELDPERLLLVILLLICKPSQHICPYSFRSCNLASKSCVWSWFWTLKFMTSVSETCTIFLCSSFLVPSWISFFFAFCKWRHGSKNLTCDFWFWKLRTENWSLIFWFSSFSLESSTSNFLAPKLLWATSFVRLATDSFPLASLHTRLLRAYSCSILSSWEDERWASGPNRYFLSFLKLHTWVLVSIFFGLIFVLRVLIHDFWILNLTYWFHCSLDFWFLINGNDFPRITLNVLMIPDLGVLIDISFESWKIWYLFVSENLIFSWFCGLLIV